ncbi:YjbH domain-containing protein [Paracoccus pacificus]|uniref:YjbH domain-containing protein n=1 Tax=Paracoccus pacificus TaxID=1463598 RepID=A0ABW4R9A8_9RHOB
MNRSPIYRWLLTTAAPALVVAGVVVGPAYPEPMTGTHLNTYGLPGIVDMPTAEGLKDGTLSVSAAWSKLGRRNNMTFQVLPRVTATLRYSGIKGLDPKQGRDYLYDRSFDLRVQVLDEGAYSPAVAVGVQDFIGTGVLGAEYVVATKTINPRLRVTAGLGWGRFANRGSIGSPFGDRPALDVGLGGKPNFKQWFRGDVAPFAGVVWQANDKLSLAAEYSGDAYEREVGAGADKPSSRINLGATYQLGQNYALTGYLIGGKTVGLQFSMVMDPRQSPFPSGLEKAPAPVRPRPSRAADPDGWSGSWSADPTAQPAIQEALKDSLAKEGQILESMALTANRAEVRIRNTRYLQQAEAIGRTSRLMTRALPPSVETLVITSVEKGMPTSSVTLRRSDIERLENTPTTEIAQYAQIGEPAMGGAGLVQTPGVFPRFQWAVGPYMSVGLFDPDEPIRYEIGGKATARYEPISGLIFAGEIRQRAFGTIGKGERSPVEPGQTIVRSDAREYGGKTHPTIPRLTMTWYARPAEAVYTRVTVGLLERAFGGVSGEVLWKPNDSRLALGAEINRVKKRDYDVLFDFQDYEVTTGHLSAYYDFGQGFVGRIDAGKYLAGDWGATVAIDREFANGWVVGAYATKTDMSAEEFGEGSFDKGITISIPLAWATGQPSKDRIGGDLRSLNRDGGSRVRISGRLYDEIRYSQKGKIYEGWGRFWR